MRKSEKLRTNAQETSLKYEVELFKKKEGNSKSLSKVNIDCKEMHDNLIQKKSKDYTRHRVLNRFVKEYEEMLSLTKKEDQNAQ